ncbi:flagellar biosynthetic protein FliR [Candidatus Enterococcus willemsii]|uniref:Flagellar biosynthetic protein FliR n=1 Tax=Candidatus Enterococcus willemsii TaxID=1857215 RepID=A0ABQ6YWE8_9ENTE|nr:flagellar biosynthetic protein FliR [Enterococcus sp. CU12B]KAF1302019.1 flagellar biosynthetic protein FliR [Enterococcus sp. CU12B]
MAQVQVFLFIFIRILSFIAVCPVFSHKGVPLMARSVLAGSLVIGSWHFVEVTSTVYPLFLFGLISVKEVLLGLAMGYVSQLIFTAVEMAGQLIDFQVGFSMGQAYDPSFQIMSSQYGKMYYWVTLALVFVLDLHHLLIQGVVTSFQLIPLGAFPIEGSTVDGIVQLFAGTFEMALNLAAPLIVTVLIIDIVLGVISRTIPQVNVLMLGMPIKTMVSFVIFLMLIPNMISYLGKRLPQALSFLQSFIESLS